MPSDTGTTNWPLDTDDLNLPSDMDTRAPTSAGDGHYTFKQWCERVTGMMRAVAHDLLTAMTHNLPMGGFKITNLADGSATTDAATWGQVQALVNGLDWAHPSVRAVATSNITLSGAQTIDGVSVIAGDRVLAAGQTTGSQNGIYAAAAGAWTRATDADASAEVNPGLAVTVEEGTANGDTVWILTTNAPITLGTTALTFLELPTPNALLAGSGLTRTGQTLAIDAAVVEQLSHKGAASGYAPLGSDSLVPLANSQVKVQVDRYMAAGTYTWTKPSWAVKVDVFAVSGGGGGGSGRRGAASSVRCGGGGGAAGGRSDGTFLASDLSATETVTVGAGGTGGAAQTVDSTDGVAGTSGSTSWFGAAAGTAKVRSGGGNNGNGGTATNGTGGSAGGGTLSGGSGAAASTSGGAGGSAGSMAGGAGGGITSGDSQSAGSAGGTSLQRQSISGGSAGTAGGGNGGSPTLPVSNSVLIGAGGGGGGGNIGGAGGTGGNGIAGSGGGGGGAALNGNSSGAGGNGADGFVIVVSVG